MCKEKLFMKSSCSNIFSLTGKIYNISIFTYSIVILKKMD